MNRVIGRLLLTGILVLGSFVSSGAYAAAVTLYDVYQGNDRDDDHWGGINYDIDRMQVSLNGSNLKVRVFTNFAGRNGDFNGSGSRRIYYGDMFLANNWAPFDSTPAYSSNPETATDPLDYKTDNFSNTGTKWEYGFALDGRFGSQDGVGQYTGAEFTAASPGTGRLYEIPLTGYADSFLLSDYTYGVNAKRGHATVLNVGDSRVIFPDTTNWANGSNGTPGGTSGTAPPAQPDGLQAVKDGSGQEVTGNWSTGPVTTEGSAEYIDFQVDLSYTNLLGVNPLTNEIDIVIHWAMTCSNDIIEAEANLPQVPIPGSFVLMASGLAGLGLIGRKRRKLKAV